MQKSRWLYNLLAGLFGAFALVSLIQHAFDIGLAPLLGEILNAYRTLFYPVGEVLLSWTRWLWPGWVVTVTLKDALALSFLGAATICRWMALSTERQNGEPLGLKEHIKLGLLGFVLGVTFFGATAAFILPLAGMTLVQPQQNFGSYLSSDPNDDILKDLMRAFATGAIGAAAFFVANLASGLIGA